MKTIVGRKTSILVAKAGRDLHQRIALIIIRRRRAVGGNAHSRCI